VVRGVEDPVRKLCGPNGPATGARGVFQVAEEPMRREPSPPERYRGGVEAERARDLSIRPPGGGPQQYPSSESNARGCLAIPGLCPKPNLLFFREDDRDRPPHTNGYRLGPKSPRFGRWEPGAWGPRRTRSSRRGRRGGGRVKLRTIDTPAVPAGDEPLPEARGANRPEAIRARAAHSEVHHQLGARRTDRLLPGHFEHSAADWPPRPRGSQMGRHRIVRF